MFIDKRLEEAIIKEFFLTIWLIKEFLKTYLEILY